MYTIYSSADKKHFEWEAETKTLPEAIKELGKWLSIRALDLDPNVTPIFKRQSLVYYIYEGKNTVEGRMVASVAIDVKRH